MKLVTPMLATLAADAPAGEGWIFEEKYDGIRALAYKKGDAVRLWSRNQLDLTSGFGEIAEAVRELPARECVLDGELVIFDPKGVSRFQLLQRRGSGGKAAYVAFDLLGVDGGSLLRRPLRERRAALEALVGRRTTGPLRLSRSLGRDGAAAYDTARERGWEGIIAKDERTAYEPGARSRSWLKVKVRKGSEFVIGGSTPPAGSREHLGALLVGLYDGAKLRYTGKVGSGYTRDSLAELARALAPLRVDEPPFSDAPRLREARWVKPRLVAQVAFAEWTADDRLRQPVFLGLRRDKAPRECRWSERER